MGYKQDSSTANKLNEKQAELTLRNKKETAGLKSSGSVSNREGAMKQNKERKNGIDRLKAELEKMDYQPHD